MLICFIRDKFLVIAIGEIEVITFKVQNRFNSNGHRRPKNLAVYVSVSDLSNGYFGYGEHKSIPDAIALLEKMQLDESIPGFVKLCSDNGWTEEKPLKIVSLY